jgi:hypothetical protein
MRPTLAHFTAEDKIDRVREYWNDSRSTGYKLGSPDAQQAQHPPVDPDEQGFPDTACIAYRLSHADSRAGLGRGIIGYQMATRYRGDLQDPRRSNRVQREQEHFAPV